MWSLTLSVTLLVVGVVGATNDVFPPAQDEAEPAHHHHHHHGRHNTHTTHDQETNHQVHNLVLNPEQHSLCELKHIRQIVTHAHCTSKEMENYVCVGTCFSYTVPQTEPEIPGDELLDYCDSCQASESHWTTIQLDCEERGDTYQVTKKIQMISNCSCSPCRPSRAGHPHHHQPPTATNEVAYPVNDHHVSELMFKMLPEGHKFKEAMRGEPHHLPRQPPPPLTAVRDANRVPLQLTDISLDDLKKKVYLDPTQEQQILGEVIIKHAVSSTDAEDEDDPRQNLTF